MDADVFISLNHFKGHETAGFGGAIKISVWAADPEPVKWNSTLRANRRSMRICAVAANDA